MGVSSETRLLNIARKLRELANDIENLVASLERPTEKKRTRTRAKDFSIDADLVDRLRGVGRTEAEQELLKLGHKQLGAIIRALGGSSEEMKKTKEMIIDRVLYRLFDYSTGHKLLKGNDNTQESN